MRSEHVQAVSALERVCFGPDWNITNFQKELDNPRCHYFVITEAGSGKAVAYLGYWQILEEAHITSVGVDPDFRKQHLAQALMCRMLEDCRVQKIRWLTLEVKASNLSAQKLYEKFGFAIMGRRKNYYQAKRQEDREDALIMWTEDIEAQAYQQFLQSLRSEIQDIEMHERSVS